MKAFLQKLQINFYSELQTILETKNNNSVRLALELSQRYLIDLKNGIIKHGFKEPQDEINCFKFIKPKLHSEVIYFRGILIAQQNLPIGSSEIKTNYLNAHLARFHVFFEDNKEFIRYSRSELNFLDEFFFIRQNAQLHGNLEVDFSDVDFRWNTGYDIILAKCIAFEKLEQQIKRELLRIVQHEEADFNLIITQNSLKKRLKWTDSKSSLVELIYALHSVGAINNGQIDLKTIAEVFQDAFQIDLGDHYRIYHELKARKIARTKFLNVLNDKLNRRMESDDE